jgi:hypothetical protein
MLQHWEDGLRSKETNQFSRDPLSDHALHKILCNLGRHTRSRATADGLIMRKHSNVFRMRHVWQGP